MKPANLLAILILFFTLPFAQAQKRLYFLFDQGCMEKHEYEVSNAGGNFSDVAFYIQTSPRLKLILESKTVERKPSTPVKAISCGSNFDPDAIMDAVNFKSMTVYVLEKLSRGGYNQYLISNAGYLLSNKNYLEFETSTYGLGYDYAPKSKQEDISLTKGYVVNYLRWKERGCPAQIEFQANQVKTTTNSGLQKTTPKPAGTRSDAEFVVAPGIGLIYERTPPVYDVYRKDVTRKLSKVNGMDVTKYMDEYCKKTTGTGSVAGNSTRPNGSDMASTSPYDQRPSYTPPPTERIYLDLNKGLHIDRNTNQPANGVYGGFRYVNGKRLTLDPTASGNYIGPSPASSTCRVVYDMSQQLYIDLNTNSLANGICEGIYYENGRRAGSVVDNSGSPDCYVYQGSDGRWYDMDTNLPATIECKGYVYINGKRVGTSLNEFSDRQPSVAALQPEGPANYGDPSYTGTSAADCNVKAGPDQHVVKPGETIYGIARKYGASVAQIKAWNNMQADNIFPCQLLFVLPPQMAKLNRPARSSTPSNYSTDSPLPKKRLVGNVEYHTVAAGETLSEIADLYGCSVEKLRAVNNLYKFQQVYEGQQLTITGCQENVAEVPASYDEKMVERLIFDDKGAATTATTAEGRKHHVVKSGDTLWGISQKYGLTVAEIKRINNLKGNTIFKGNKIYLE